MFTPALFTVSKISNLSVQQQIKKVFYMYVYIYNIYTMNISHKKEWSLPFATIWMVLEDIMFSDISQKRKTNTAYYYF